MSRRVLTNAVAVGAMAASLAVAVVPALRAQGRRDTLWSGPGFTLLRDGVVQGPFRAWAIGADTLLSTYPRAARELRFKFALNGRDDEFPPGTEHTIYVRPVDGRVVTSVNRFGVPPEPRLPVPRADEADPSGVARVTVRLDLRHVRDAIARDGRFVTPTGDTVSRLDRVSVIGDGAPLTWSIAATPVGGAADLRDDDGDGLWETTLDVAVAYARPLDASRRARWTYDAAHPGVPALDAPEPVLAASYRLATEELAQLVRDDGALSAGAKWPGVWTRDVSYAGVLALAIAAPDALRTSLLAKVDADGRITQDTGTGGSWPVSSDRMTWGLAAWELYAVTRDTAWRDTARAILARSFAADTLTVAPMRSGVVRGETSFLDWREQSYPRWMQPEDIAQSRALGTSLVEARAAQALDALDRDAGAGEAPWLELATSIYRRTAREFARSDEPGFAAFLTGGLFEVPAARHDALATSLVILTGALRSARPARLALLANVPRMPFGVPTTWPFTAGVPRYHNGSVWPFVNAFATWAAAFEGHGAAVEHGLATTLRVPALFLTHKENLVAETGHFEGTALNSDRQLWSVAGTLAMAYRVLFGLRYGEDALRIAPAVPPAWDGVRTLRGVPWGSAVLDVTVRGHGLRVQAARVDGVPVAPRGGMLQLAPMRGRHVVELELDGAWPADAVRLVDALDAPATPEPRQDGGTIVWAPVAGADRYVVHVNGRILRTGRDTLLRLAAADTLAEVQVVAERAGVASFPSVPVRVIRDDAIIVARPPAERRDVPGEHGGRAARVAIGHADTLTIPVTLPRGGAWAVEVRYANGNGPINTGNTAATRRAFVDGSDIGTVVMPQRGDGAWSTWGTSPALVAELAAGRHELRLVVDRRVANMRGDVNEARIDHVRFVPLGSVPSAWRRQLPRVSPP